MKLIILMLSAGVIGAVLTSGPVTAETADDRKWIAQCIADNKGEAGATPEIARAYCTCMNEAMDDSDSRSVTQFEKANPKARMKCEKAAGWK